MSAGPHDLQNQTVLVRCDLSLGLECGVCRRPAQSRGRGARVAVIAGYDNPGGDVNPTCRCAIWLRRLQELTGLPVHFVGDCVGPVAESGLAATPAGAIALDGEPRFHPEAQRHSRTFAIRLSVAWRLLFVPGGMPESASVWIRELAKLLPEPTTNLAPSA
jgi:3-phosphoglycerate kinase